MSVIAENTEPRYTVLLTSGGAVVRAESFPGQYYDDGRHEPPLIRLPQLPRTSAVWIEHAVDAAGRLLRVEREKPAFAVRVFVPAYRRTAR